MNSILKLHPYQFYLASLGAERDASLLERQSVFAENFATPAVQGRDVRGILQGQALQVIGACHQARRDMVVLALGTEQYLEQGDERG